MKIRYSILAGFIFASILFVYLALTSKMSIAIAVSIFIFIVSPFVFYFKMFRKVDFGAKFQKIDKVLVVYSGMASHFKDGISVGGTLYLLNDRLIFQTNALNFSKRHEQLINLDQITNVEVADTFDFVANGLVISHKPHQNEQFVVANREVWKQQIEKQIFARKPKL